MKAARIAFLVAWVAGQATLVLTAGARPDNAFGFRMFGESSTLRYHLARTVDAPSGHGTTTIDAPAGAWSAHTRDGTLRHFAWSERVHEPALATFDTTMHASYGASAQLSRLEAALSDVAARARADGDSDTRELVLQVTVRRNGREPSTLTFRRAVAP